MLIRLGADDPAGVVLLGVVGVEPKSLVTFLADDLVEIASRENQSLLPLHNIFLEYEISWNSNHLYYVLTLKSVMVVQASISLEVYFFQRFLSFPLCPFKYIIQKMFFPQTSQKRNKIRLQLVYLISYWEPQDAEQELATKTVTQFKKSFFFLPTSKRKQVFKNNFHPFFYGFLGTQLHHYDDLTISLNTVQLKSMIPSQKHETKHEDTPPIVSESDLALFEELQSIGPQNLESFQERPPPNYQEGSFSCEAGSPKLLPLRHLHEGLEHRAQPSLFQKLSAQGSQSSFSQISSSQTIKHQLQNDTKNIPKNFGKGILNFIQKNQSITRAVLKGSGISYGEMMRYARSKKPNICTIAELRELWIDEKMGKCMRVLSNLFLRKYCLGYIFNSRIVSYASHIKYRTALWEALKHPSDFNHIKYH